MILVFGDLMNFCTRFEKESNVMNIFEIGVRCATKMQRESDNDGIKEIHPLGYVSQIGREKITEVYREFGDVYTIVYNISKLDEFWEIAALYMVALVHNLNCGAPYDVIFRFVDDEDRRFFNHYRQEYVSVMKTVSNKLRNVRFMAA